MLTQETIEIQKHLASYCKNTASDALPGITPGRLQHYKRLIYNILEDALSSAYPITRDQLSDEEWELMINEFHEEHTCAHPQIFRMPEELIDFADEKKYTERFNKPWLIDLLLFEWAEIEVHTMEDVTVVPAPTSIDFLYSPLLFNPYLMAVRLSYPVHEIKKEDISSRNGAFFYLIYRQPSGTVQYMNVNALSFSIVSALMEQDYSLSELLEAHLLGREQNEVEQVSQQAVAFLNQLADLGIVWGNDLS